MKRDVLLFAYVSYVNYVKPVPTKFFYQMNNTTSQGVWVCLFTLIIYLIKWSTAKKQLVFMLHVQIFLLLGWLSDKSCADCLLINNVALIVGGLATIACPFCDTFPLLVVYCSIFGVCMGKCQQQYYFLFTIYILIIVGLL